MINPTCLPDYIWNKIQPDSSGCWIWTGLLIEGYGQQQFEKKCWRAHRLVYTLIKGPIPHGLVADHLCNMKNCVNPLHIQLVTTQENVSRSNTGRRASYCKNGHNTSFLGSRSGGNCKQCTKLKMHHKRNLVIDDLVKQYIPDLPIHIASKIEILEESGCWKWTGGVNPSGYPVSSLMGKPMRAHRIIYQFAKGELVDELVIDHICHNRLCVNPDHLQQITQEENSQRIPKERKASKAITCKRGHPYIGNRMPGCGRCIICARDYMREFQRNASKKKREASMVDGKLPPRKLRKDRGLTDDQVRLARNRFCTLKRLVSELGISITTISQIRSRKIYKSVQDLTVNV